MKDKYLEFVSSKIKRIERSGFTPERMNEKLFPFQRFCLTRALENGRFALFEDCGLGKTIQQLEWAHQVSEHTGERVIILAPLAVSGQTKREAEKFGVPLGNIDVVNYEQLHNIDTSQYAGVVLDESSILKNFEGKYRTQIIEAFQNTPYKLACTATPAPNDPMEIGNHAEFLNVMSRNEMLSMYFVHDGGETAKWRLKKHCRKLFFEWMSSWSVMLSRPSDIGFDDQGYDLPPLNFIEKQIVTDKRSNGLLFNDVAVSATNLNQELRLTKVERMDQVSGIVNNSDDQFIIWIKQNEEGDLLRSLIPDAIEVKGSDTPQFKEKTLLGFADKKHRVLITKTKIAQFGLNFQNCHNQIFASLDFGFEGLYQGIRRSYRFGQTHPVNIYIITTDTMTNVIKSITAKEKQFRQMQDAMTASMNACVSRKEYEYKNHKINLPQFIKVS